MPGGAAVGCESGYFLAGRCRTEVHILEMRGKICMDSAESRRLALIPRMRVSCVKRKSAHGEEGRV